MVPLCNEEGSVHPLVRELVAVLEGIGVTYEIVLLDDGSRDATWERITRLAAAMPAVIGVSRPRLVNPQDVKMLGVEELTVYPVLY